jgi:multiple sugar transport system substrate-binding protein
VGTVRYLAPDTDAYVASVQRHAPEFEEQTGHRLEIRILGSDEYFSNRIGPRLGGDDAADVFMSGPVLLWEHVGAGLVEPLDEHLAEVDGEFDLRDFLPRLLEVNRWTGRAGDPLGSGPLLQVPVNCESYNLAFVPHILTERPRGAADLGGLLRGGPRRRARHRWGDKRIWAARPRRVAHDVHRLRDPAVELRRARLRP